MKVIDKSRVFVKDERTGQVKVKSPAQIVRANQELAQRLSRGKVSVNDDQLKRAIREDNFRSIVAKNNLTEENEAVEQTLGQEGEEAESNEIVDLRTEPEPVVEVETVEEENLNMVTGATAKRHVSLKFGVIGSGQAGGRIAEVFNQYGYDACALNTASQDLEFLDIPKENKFLVEVEDKVQGGAGKDLDIGAACFSAREEDIAEFIQDRVGHCEAFILAVSGGGGSGSGSAEMLTYLLAELGKPVVVIYILPGAFDDPQSKHNAVVTLTRLSDLSEREIINSLILVDNANIERNFTGLSQAVFYETANKAVVEPLHMFNSVSVTPTNYEALDSMDFAKSLIEAGNCAVFGTTVVEPESYEDDETALMEAIIDGLEGGLLASGFELKEAQNVGILVTAKQSVLEKIPFTSIAYMFKYIQDEFDSAKSFKGVYAIPSENENVTVRFIFSGMGLPKERIDSLQTEAKKHMDNLEFKKKNTKMHLTTGKDRATDEVDRRIAAAKKKKSGIGKLIGGGPKKITRRR